MTNQNDTIENLMHSIFIENDWQQGECLPEELVSIIRKHLIYAYVTGFEELYEVIKAQVIKHRNSDNRSISSTYVLGLCDGFRNKAAIG